MFVRLYVGLVLMISNEILLIKGSPISQGRSETDSTYPLQENLPQEAENNYEDGEINKIVAFANLPLTTVEAFDENDGDLPITTSFELNQTSVSNLQENFQKLEAEENVNDFHSELLTSIGKSGNGNEGLTSESPVNVKGTTPIQINPQYHNISSKTTHTGDANRISLNHDSDSSPPQIVIVESLHATTPRNGSVNSFMNGYYSDYEDLHNANINEHYMEGNMNDDENDEFLQNDEDEDSLPSALKNLPHDIPPDRTIYEVLAENIVKDKQYDEFRIEELIHELMDHYDTHNGLGEVYAAEADYDEKERPDDKGSISILDHIVQASSTTSPNM